MPATYKIKTLLDSLQPDEWRKENSFSEALRVTSSLLLHPFSTRSEKEIALAAWLQRFQPCVFGRLAAKASRIHYCILTHDELRESDQLIASKVDRERKIWKQLALNGGAYSCHSFLLIVCSEKILLAAPDSNLRQFALAIQNLVTETTEADQYGNTRSFEYIYLRRPADKAAVRFKVILDFFASAGDGRWWLDHRIPGGIGFTFNSLGHMIRTQEWYRGEKERLAWATKLAMSTIDAAESHPVSGKATWLIDLDEGKAFKEGKCPFSDVNLLPSALRGKDWSSYEGFHHTDHSVRDEFFLGDREVPTQNRPWRMDFSYIYTRVKDEDSEIMDGTPVTERELLADLGPSDEWRIAPRRTRGDVSRPEEATKEIIQLLEICKLWKSEPVEILGIEGTVT